MTAAAAALVLPLGLAGHATLAGATTPSATTCSGASLAAGTYSSVTVTGVCQVNSGQVTVTGNVTVQAGAALLAAYVHDVSGPGTSGLTVNGDIDIASGATLVLGCEAQAFPCFDDMASPSLNSPDTVDGSIEATSPLGVLLHDSTVGHDAVETGGGGGASCTPSGIFATLGSPVYSDYEDNSIGGNLRVTGLISCWFGAIRNTIGGSATFADGTFADPDASENLTNTIAGNLLCSGNSPVVQYGDSGGSANVVSGFAAGECAFGVTQPSPPPAGTPKHISVQNAAPSGYWLAAGDAGLFSFGVPYHGPGATPGLAAPISGIAAVPGTGSYYLPEGNGDVFEQGPTATDCPGLNGQQPLNKPIIGITAAPGGNGCWLAGADGGVFAFGSNAPFFGSAGSLSLVQPIVGIAGTPNNDGYLLAAADGGVFNYGPGATFFGSMGGQSINQPVVGVAVDPQTGGYWLVARDGGVFSFNAPFFGSLGGSPLNKPIVGIVAAPGGDGYYLVAADGGVFAFGSGAHFQGSTGSLHLNEPVVGMALG